MLEKKYKNLLHSHSFMKEPDTRGSDLLQALHIVLMTERPLLAQSRHSEA